MKIKKITLRNYKKFMQSKTISFTDSEGNVNEKTLLVGNNGTGKSSILQAIVMLLTKAVRQNFDTEKLDWPGFEYKNLKTGRQQLKIEAEILFNDKEIETTRKYAQQLIDSGVKLGGIPTELNNVKIYWDYETSKSIARGNRKVFYQFSGYQYAKRLVHFTPNKDTLFENIGNIYWYTEQRNSHNITNLEENEDTQLDDIRNFLASAYTFHTALKDGTRKIKEGEFDFYEKLKTIYEKVFPSRKLVGASPRFDIYEKAPAPNFYLYDGHSDYEISGMSAGERAIFPILMDFARWNINNSIIIIDELELHLHPPLQQTLVRALLQMGKNNQFIFTSHSNSVISMFDEAENQIIRLQDE